MVNTETPAEHINNVLQVLALLIDEAVVGNAYYVMVSYTDLVAMRERLRRARRQLNPDMEG